MSASEPILRLATPADAPELRRVMELAIAQLQSDVLGPAQIEASRSVMGLDTQLIADRTYFVVLDGGVVAGCGGWSRRATLYGGDHAASPRDARLLDPDREPARIRAMYTHPGFARRGIGRLILASGEDAARAEGFHRVELMATLAGERLYRACGYDEVERIHAEVRGVAVPLVRMAKTLRPSAG